MRSGSRMLMITGLVLALGSVEALPPQAPPPPLNLERPAFRRAAEPAISWYSNRTSAVEAAQATNKLILLLAGTEGSYNSQYMKTQVCESGDPDVRGLIDDHFIPWFADANGTNDDWMIYAPTSSFYYPLICCISNQAPDDFIDRTESIQPVGAFYERLYFVAHGSNPPPVLYSIGEPSAEEQYMLELINRARADAMAEAQRLRATQEPYTLAAYAHFHTDLEEMVRQFAYLRRTVPPLAMSAKLLAAARLHSQDMLTNVFQGHYSSSHPPPPNQPGDSPGDRAERQEYDWRRIGESVYAYANNTEYAHNSFEVDWGSGPYGMQVPPQHRTNNHDALFREIGIGILRGSNTKSNEIPVGPMVVTHDYGQEMGNAPLITGVAYWDQNSNGFYDIGEGLGDVTVRVQNVFYYAATPSSGGYAIPIAEEGTYQVAFSHGLITGHTTSVVVGVDNVKVDFRFMGPPPPGVRRPIIVSPTAFNARWNAVSGVTNYYLQVASDSQMTNLLEGFENYRAGTAREVLVTLTNGWQGPYYYRVRSENENGSGFWSSRQVVLLQYPSSLTPVYLLLFR